jgi:hypothetical protein
LSIDRRKASTSAFDGCEEFSAAMAGSRDPRVIRNMEKSLFITM